MAPFRLLEVGHEVERWLASNAEGRQSNAPPAWGQSSCTSDTPPNCHSSSTPCGLHPIASQGPSLDARLSPNFASETGQEAGVRRVTSARGQKRMQLACASIAARRLGSSDGHRMALHVVWRVEFWRRFGNGCSSASRTDLKNRSQPPRGISSRQRVAPRPAAPTPLLRSRTVQARVHIRWT